MNDSEMLDWLESFIRREGGIVLHDHEHGGGPYAGLGLRAGLLNRTLREAIVRAAAGDNTTPEAIKRLHDMGRL